MIKVNDKISIKGEGKFYGTVQSIEKVTYSVLKGNVGEGELWAKVSVNLPENCSFTESIEYLKVDELETYNKNSNHYGRTYLD
tara:strand:+ start:55 stop:303 length:249 start_codon:yes stop_codon:yes gene_type:complete